MPNLILLGAYWFAGEMVNSAMSKSSLFREIDEQLAQVELLKELNAQMREQILNYKTLKKEGKIN